MNKTHLYILCSALALVGLAVTAYRALVLEFPLTPQETQETWRVEARVSFAAKGEPVRVTLMVPHSIPTLTLFDENYISPGYGLTTMSPDQNRRAIFSKRTAKGEQVLYYRAVIHKSLSREAPAPAPTPQLIRPDFTGARLAAARQIVNALDETSADTDSFVRLLFERFRTASPRGPDELLLGKSPSAAIRVDIAVRILSLAKIPARVVQGLALNPDRRNARISHWIEVYEDQHWRPFDPNTNEFQRPKDHLPWWRGPEKLATVQGGTNLHTNIAVRRVFVYSLQSALAKSHESRNKLIAFSVFGLPLQTQEVYRLLLTVPIGIFLLVILRNVVGLRTFGTFMPVLIALAFRQTELLWGFILFTSVMAAGLLVRFYLEQLKLLLVPRLAAVVIVVILIMALISVFSYRLGFERGLSVALFPIVILSMTIERMMIVWDERGAAEALKQAAGSFVVAVICYLAMNLEIVKYFVFVFPESLLILLAGVLLLGRYSGYRLVELPRFKALAGGGR